MAHITIYTKENCPYCRMAKELFAARHLTFEEIRIDLDEAKREEMIRLSNRRTVPQIFINSQSIGGYDDLTSLVKTGKLDAMLKNQ
ncbi:MAG: glutaredoxin 3 [Gammaproteobacteria bacterium RIFCSPHIGHO2_12_FULL_37_34]|nr:MAG: glutaredoxin 3 [Gammaproteobacteria bacterium RIFCSPHIGHO2_12_FULL_37_34]